MAKTRICGFKIIGLNTERSLILSTIEQCVSVELLSADLYFLKQNERLKGEGAICYITENKNTFVLSGLVDKDSLQGFSEKTRSVTENIIILSFEQNQESLCEVLFDGRQAIKNSVLSDTQKNAEQIIENASLKMDDELKRAQLEFEQVRQSELKKAEEQAQEYINAEASKARIEQKKALLKAKQEALSQVYSQAITKIMNMADNLYRDFIGEIIKKYAENNDYVIIAQRDAKRLTREWLEKLSESLNIRLSLSTDYHSSLGGVILSNKTYDKNITFSTLLNKARNETEAKVVVKLFDRA